jgi:hypothetical protein
LYPKELTEEKYSFREVNTDGELEEKRDICSGSG